MESRVHSAGACCRSLLSEGLDLCVRARKLDAQDATNAMLEVAPGMDMGRYMARHPEENVMPKSGTIALWVLEQYQTDLADWERRSRHHLSMGCNTPAQAGDA